MAAGRIVGLSVVNQILGSIFAKGFTRAHGE